MGLAGMLQHMGVPVPGFTAWVVTLVEVLGGVALLGLIFFRNRERMPQWFLKVTLALALVAAASALWTANLGGQIRHPEASFGAPAPPAAPSLHAGAR